MGKCKVCHYQVSTKAIFCPNCRAFLKKRWLIYLLGGVCIIALLEPHASQQLRDREKPLDKEGCLTVHDRIYLMATLRDAGADKATILRAMEDTQGAIDALSHGINPARDLKAPQTEIERRVRTIDINLLDTVFKEPKMTPAGLALDFYTRCRIQISR